jgi:hypothetical protein
MIGQSIFLFDLHGTSWMLCQCITISQFIWTHSGTTISFLCLFFFGIQYLSYWSNLWKCGDSADLNICDLQLRAFLQSHALPDTQIYAKIENSEVNIMLLRRYCHQFVLMLFWLLRCAFHVRVWIILMTFSKRRMASFFLEETWELTFLQKT